MVKLSYKVLVEFNGKIACIKEHCQDLGISYNALLSRHRRTGEPYEKCLEYFQENGIRFINNTKIEFNGKIASISEHCKDLNVSGGAIYYRMKKTGETILECLEYYQKNGVRHRNKYKVKDKYLYKRWYDAKDRCYNPKCVSYPRYGGRGIKMCERWQDYENFENDMLESFLEHVKEFGLKDTQIERNNYDGNYEPSNCRWSTRKEQANNRSSNYMITEYLTAKQFAEKYNINYNTVLSRLNASWSLERIINVSASKYIGHNIKYLLPCGIGLRKHCKQNEYRYRTIIRYIKKYNLQPHEALAKWLSVQ